ncbi:MAG TPA: peptidylprolyl isomerase [Verrucomicrobiae bacterium]|nr:peptidylprolyl isomerase [Verrucomicrobiae bacterium]
MSYLRTICGLIAFITVLHSAGAGTLVQFRTVFGDMEVELYDQDKPVTVQNFLNYVKTGHYQNGIAHRLVPGFVLQGGGYTLVSNTISPIATFPPITNEFDVGRQFSNVFGTIAMAKLGGDTNSATSQWYLNLTNNAFLDAPNTNDLFVVFGHVIAGTNVLNIFNSFQNYTGTQQSNLVANVDPALGNVYYPNFATCPLLYPVIAQTNFIFVNISLLQVAISPAAGGGKQISWNSATGLTNLVEYATNFPPVWNTLVTTNGTGAPMTVVDNAAAPSRFYRVQVVY